MQGGTVVAQYTYDSFNRLTSETANGVTTKWTYDANGNILTRTSNGTTITYKYGDGFWKDLLTSYNGQNITYDNIGNPLTWGSTSFTWEAGRRLSGITKSGVKTTFTYDASGYRTSKTSGGVTTNYYLDGDRITALKKGSDVLSFTYDEKGQLVGFFYDNFGYAYVKNLQGDIIGIVNESGAWVVTYTYDAWGKLISTTGSMASTLGVLNPFRYRGYCYDEETGLYYLNSRYYDPVVGRFINSDTTSVIQASPMALTDKNLYAYCDSNPVVRIDTTGMYWDTILDIISVCVSVKDVVEDPNNVLNWVSLGVDAICVALPVVAGGGLVMKAVTKVDDTVDIARGVKLVDAYNAAEASAKVMNKAELSYDVTKGLRHTPDQQALMELAKDYKNGICREEANILVDWAVEYGVNNHRPKIHPNRRGYWSRIEHIKLFNIHIQIKQ